MDIYQGTSTCNPQINPCSAPADSGNLGSVFCFELGHSGLTLYINVLLYSRSVKFYGLTCACFPVMAMLASSAHGPFEALPNHQNMSIGNNVLLLHIKIT